MSLSDAATASDALDSDITDRLGPAPEPGMGPAPTAPKRSHHKRGPKVSVSASAPHASQFVKPISGILVLVTLITGLVLCGFNLDDPLVEIITMDGQKHEDEEQSEAESIAKPAANIAARQAWFMEHAQALINGEDAIALVLAIVMYGTRVVPAVQQRMRERPREPSRQAGGISRQSVPPSGNGYGPSGYEGLSGAYAADAN